MHELDAIVKSKIGMCRREIKISHRDTKIVISDGHNRSTHFRGEIRESFPEEVFGHLDFEPVNPLD